MKHLISLIALTTMLSGCGGDCSNPLDPISCLQSRTAVHFNITLDNQSGDTLRLNALLMQQVDSSDCTDDHLEENQSVATGTANGLELEIKCRSASVYRYYSVYNSSGRALIESQKTESENVKLVCTGGLCSEE